MAQASLRGKFVFCFRNQGEFDGKPFENYKITIFDEEGFSNDKFLTLTCRLETAKKLGLDKPQTTLQYINKDILLNGKMSTREGRFQFEVLDMKLA